MFGERLKQLRKENKMLQKDLADLLKVSSSTIGMYERNQRDPDTSTLRYLADYFNVSVDFLLGRTDHRQVFSGVSENEESYLEGLDAEQIKAVKNMINAFKKN
tara:strand:+ start:142 stop:450 length:309 start_codon:yes stop_codon:yes gene_type:complete